MGTCTPNCLIQKKQTMVLEVDVEDPKEKEEIVQCLGRGKTMAMRTATIKEGEENIDIYQTGDVRNFE